MKKSFLIVSAIALASAVSSYADLTINISGSSAFRAAAFTAIRNQLGAGYKASYTNASASKDSSAAATFQKNVGGSYGLVTIKCAFAGSGDGCDAAIKGSGATAGFQTNFIPTSALPVSGENFSQTANSSEYATVGFSDIYPSSASSALHVLRGYNDSDCLDATVGVVPFQLVTNKAGKDAGLTNVTAQQLRLLFSNGVLTNGSAGFGATANLTVYATGRKADSGTRATILAECGYGLSSSVIHYKVETNGSLTSLGDSGESATNIVSYLNNNNCTSIVIGTLGNSDAALVTQGGILTYEGVANTDANVKNGVYTMWSYQHLLQRSDAPALQQQWLTSLTWDSSTIGSAGIPVDAMLCVRTADGALVSF
jgi:hypothetical protein